MAEAYFLFDLEERLCLLVLGTYLALLLGGPRWLHTLLFYDAPSQGWRSLLKLLEERLNRLHRPRRDRIARGRLVVLILICITLGSAISLMMLSSFTSWGWYIEIICIAYLLPIRAATLPHLEMRKAIKMRQKLRMKEIASQLTERDVDHLDGHSLIRVTIMSLARLLPRYVITPSVYYLLGGLAGLMLCRLLSCMADMLPHSHPRYRSFGASAYFWDTMLQAIPVRLCLPVLWLGLLFVPKASLGKGAKGLLYSGNTPVHSRNLPLRIVAHGLGISLAGPGLAGGHPLSEAWIGHGKAKLDSVDLSRSLIWYGCTAILWIVIISAAYVSLHL